MSLDLGLERERLLFGLLVTELLSPFVLKLVFEKYTGSKKNYTYIEESRSCFLDAAYQSCLLACSTHARNAYYGLMLTFEVDRRLLKGMEIINAESGIRFRH